MTDSTVRNFSSHPHNRLAGLAGLVATLLCFAPMGVQAQSQPARAASTLASAAVQTADYIVAQVNAEPVTHFEVRERMWRMQQQASSQGQTLQAGEELFQQALEQLVVERALLAQAQEQGVRVDEAAVQQAEQTIAAQNQLSLEDFRKRAQAQGLDPQKIRTELRNQLLLQTLREREVKTRVEVSEAEIDAFVAERYRDNAEAAELNLGHVLIRAAENASEQQLNELLATAQGVVLRLRAGAKLAEEARAHSQGSEAATGGLMGMRTLSRLPDLFVKATRELATGEVAPPLRSPAGFHVLQVVEKRQAPPPEFTVTQSRVRHILLRPGVQLSQEQAIARLAGYRQRVLAQQARFDELARAHSQDSSAAQGGDLGWAVTGQFVPEFEQAMNALQPGQVSQPVVSRFGVHLIALDERRQGEMSARELRESARELVRQAKAEQTLQVWINEVRGRAFVEYRDPPTQ